MSEKEVDILSAVLRDRVSRFFKRSCAIQNPYGRGIDRLFGRGDTVALFGGAIRDLMAGGSRAIPRDLDLVTGASDTRSLVAIFGAGKANAFGGRRTQIGRTEIDYWPLSRTWAFRALGVGSGGFEDLARTTFLNVEAIAIRLEDLARWEPGPWESPFFHAFLDRVVEINLEANPNPLGCVTRSLVTASRLGFAIGPRLASYIDHHSRRLSLEEMVQFQWQHYKAAPFSVERLAFVRSSIRSHMRTRKMFPFRLFSESSAAGRFQSSTFNPFREG
jgi:hypothetical protein